ncbi:MAG: type II toxin-antitoxin system PemK/MazF family toxin [Lachnospiraceae bacterium]|nr:type II toxin-antitoxin system PemK/MazF family toxin [Lachnospiraceae bacterium]
MNVNQAIKYPKGSIWWLQAECLPVGEHITKKARPVVIVSGNNRGQTDVVEVCTITSADKMGVCKGINVPFRNTYGRTNYIQTNQHFTVNVKNLRDFQGILSSNSMQKLNSALRFAQDLGDIDDLSQKAADLERQLSAINMLDCDKQALKSGIAYLNTMISEITTYISNANLKLAEIQKKVLKILQIRV